VIAFQVAFLTMSGSLYYWARRVTGRLWVPMLLHALTDCVAYLVSGASSAAEALSADASENVVVVIAQALLIAAATLGVLSAAREDVRARRRIPSAGGSRHPPGSAASSSAGPNGGRRKPESGERPSE